MQAISYGSLKYTLVYVQNHRGDTIALVSNSTVVARLEYSAWGAINYQLSTTNSPAPFFTFSGKHYDEGAALYYYGYRWYDAVAKRWTQPDPSGLAEGLDLYQFCWNDPINGVDVYGMYDVPYLDYFQQYLSYNLFDIDIKPMSKRGWLHRVKDWWQGKTADGCCYSGDLNTIYLQDDESKPWIYKNLSEVMKNHPTACDYSNWANRQGLSLSYEYYIITMLHELVHQEQMRILGPENFQKYYDQYNRELGDSANPLEKAASEKALEIYDKLKAGLNMSYRNPFTRNTGNIVSQHGAIVIYAGGQIYINGVPLKVPHSRNFLQ